MATNDRDHGASPAVSDRSGSDDDLQTSLVLVDDRGRISISDAVDPQWMAWSGPVKPARRQTQRMCVVLKFINFSAATDACHML